MLLKKNRADKKTVDEVFKKGRIVNSPSLTFRFLKLNKSPSPRISFIVSKSIAKLAVRRNSLRRKGYAVLKKHFAYFPLGLLGVFIFKKYQDDVLILENEIKNILNKIN